LASVQEVWTRLRRLQTSNYVSSALFHGLRRFARG
jgi:hypothetical protein